MYTYFWRSSPYPFLRTFDAPDAVVACTRRPRSNTPLQALTLANDPAFYEIAHGFAERLLREEHSGAMSRVRAAFRAALSREPSAVELASLGDYLLSESKRFAEASPDETTAIAPANAPSNVAPAEAAAFTMLARVLLNLDEFITRE